MWVILPLKDLVLAKQRLSGVLSDSERRGLFQAMVEDVLVALCASQRVAEVVLLSDDPSAPLLAEHHGVLHWQESSLQTGSRKGLNAALDAAVRQSVVQGVREVMIVHGDIPVLDVAEVDAFIDAHRATEAPRKLTINPDAAGTGTNVMALTPPDLLTFEYGSQSAQLHIEQAQEQGVAVHQTRFDGMCTDIDDFEDLRALLALIDDSRAAATRQYLLGSGIRSRLELLGDDTAMNESFGAAVAQHFE